MLCRGAWTHDDSGTLESTGTGDTRGHLAISSNGHQLLVIKVMQPSELSKTSFRGDRAKNKYLRHVNYIKYCKFGCNIDLKANGERARCKTVLANT